MAIHPTAVVARQTQLGRDVEIGPYCIVGEEVRLGDRTRLHSHVVVQGDTWLGNDCEVFPFAVLGTLPQDKKLKEHETGGMLRIGDKNRIREHVTIHGGTSFGGGITRIGNANMLLVGSHIGHDATVGDHTVFTNGAMVAGHTWVGDRAILGAMAGVHQFARIGPYAMIGGGAMLTHDAPPFGLVQGDRAGLVGVNLVGLHRNRFTLEQTALIKRVFRLLFWRSGKMHDKVEFVRRSPMGREEVVATVLDFVASSQRGMCMPRIGRRGTTGPDREAVDVETD